MMKFVLIGSGIGAILAFLVSRSMINGGLKG